MADIRSMLFASNLRAALVILGVLVATVSGAYLTGAIGAPSVDGVENRFGNVTADTTTIETDLFVSNPNPIGLQLGGVTVNYSVTMNDIPMASGMKEGLAIGRGTTALNFTTLMDNRQIPAWWASHIDSGEQTELRINARIHSSLLGQSVSVPQTETISTDIISQFNSSETRPVNADQPLVSDPVLYINRTSAAWGAVTQSRTPIEMAFVLYNPKTTPYTLTEVGYEITMNDIVVGEGTTDDPYTIPGRTQETVEAVTAINNPALDEWWISHLRRNQVTELRIDFYIRVELATGDSVQIPVEELTYTERIETDFFGTKPATDSNQTDQGTRRDTTTAAATATNGVSSVDDGILDQSTETATATDAPTASDETTTATPSTDDSDTATPTPTPTDDGGLLAVRIPGWP